MLDASYSLLQSTPRRRRCDDHPGAEIPVILCSQAGSAVVFENLS